MKRRIALLIAALVGVLGVVVVIPAGSAQACTTCGSDTGGTGYSVTATVHFSGDAAPGGGGGYSMSVPASCWWESWGQVPADPAKWVDFYNDYVKGLGSGSEVAAGYFTVPRIEAWQAAAARAAAGEKIAVYQAHCVDSDLCKIKAFVGGETAYDYPGMECPLPLLVNFFPAGAPPAPQVDPEDLARIARDNMVIDNPIVDRNPKVTAVDQATLVGLPTWFWVTNPASVGGATGTRTIRAEVGPVWAEVVATTGGLTITSPAGGRSCAPTVASTAYSPGASDAAGCTIAFSRASVGYAGGYPVDASTAWTATWTGSGGAGGQLDGLARTTTVNVPVAESQALVQG